jgi:hypothetical protein
LNLQPANFSGTSGEFLEGKITCPACHEVWGTVDAAIYSLHTDVACPHLKFYVENAGGDVEVHYFNGFTATELMTAVEIAGHLLAPDLDGKTVEHFFAHQQSENGFWAKLKCQSLDTILVHVDSDDDPSEQSFNYTVHFGARLK